MEESTLRWPTDKEREEGRKFVPQVRCCIPRRAVSDFETRLSFWVKESGSGRLDGNDIAKVMWTGRMRNLISGINNFVFDALLYLKPVEIFENLVRIRRPGSCNNGTSKRILDMLETS